MTDSTEYIWARQKGETDRAYEAFRFYLDQGTGRSIRRAVELDSKTVSYSTYCQWSSANNWVERATAFDQFVAAAETDGMVSQLASVREKHIVLADKLLDHLDTRLNFFITREQDPTMRWVQAFTAAIKAHQGAFMMKDNERTSELLNTAQELLARLEDEERGAQT